ncbi:MAG: DKNYY domain-containing protein [Saprospiraceae bacterium]|nr:DKNYY domain-containing protein [Saprospiraceae bacterium]
MKNTLLFFAFLFFISCNEGYRKQNGQWAWVTYRESFKKKVAWVYPVDKKTFKVLSDKRYAKDKDRVFYTGREIKDADPRSFKVIDKYGYAKDRNNVFLDREKVIFAKPGSFEVLEFPYARDENHVFCGTLPMNLGKSEMAEFKVINADKLMAHTKSTALLSYFIELNPEYSWLDTLGVEHVIVGNWGTGETRSKKFKGFEEVK